MRVLISGAGIAGSTLASLLARTGRVRVDVVEKASSILSHGQNVDLNGSAVTVMKRMGLLDQVRAANTSEKGTQFVNGRGRVLSNFPLRQDSTVGSPTSELEILRGDLARVLGQAALAQPSVDVRFGTTVKSVLSNDIRSVRVEFDDGRTDEYDLLVIADGQWSKLRTQCFPAEGDVSVVDLRTFAIYWTLPRLADDNDLWNIYIALRSRLLSIRPDPHGTVRACLSCMPTTEADLERWNAVARAGRTAQEELVRQELGDAGWQADRLLASMSSAPDFYFQPVKQIKMARWSTSRVVCLGDTAHAPTPFTGLGTTLAIAGAYRLAGELSTLADGQHPSSALNAFERGFRPQVESGQTIPSVVPGIAHPGTAFKRAFLQTALVGAALVARWLSTTSRFATSTDSPSESNDDGFPCPGYPTLDEKLK